MKSYSKRIVSFGSMFFPAVDTHMTRHSSHSCTRQHAVPLTHKITFSCMNTDNVSRLLMIYMRLCAPNSPLPLRILRVISPPPPPFSASCVVVLCVCVYMCVCIYIRIYMCVFDVGAIELLPSSSGGGVAGGRGILPNFNADSSNSNNRNSPPRPLRGLSGGSIGSGSSISSVGCGKRLTRPLSRQEEGLSYGKR